MSLTRMLELAGLTEEKIIDSSVEDLADSVIEAMRQIKRQYGKNDKRAVKTMVFVLASLAQMAIKIGDKHKAGAVISLAQKLDALSDKLETASAGVK